MTTTVISEDGAEELPRLDMYLVGAPGSGKSALADAFAKAAKPWFEERKMKPPLVLDGLPQALREDGNIQLGGYGNYFDSASIWYHAEVRRERARQSQRTFIDTQSLISTLAHINARLSVMQHLVMTEELQVQGQLELAHGQAMTLYLPTRWMNGSVNFAWYLPLPEQIIVPGRDRETFPVAVDAVLRDMNLKLGLNIPLLDGTLEERVERMMKDLDDAYNEATHEDSSNVQ